MVEETIVAIEATKSEPIQQIETLLNQIDGMERVLVDTNDGEIKVEFDEEKVSREQIVSTLKANNFQV